MGGKQVITLVLVASVAIVFTPAEPDPPVTAVGPVDGVADFNGDGYGDLVVGIPAVDYSVDVNGDGTAEVGELQDGGLLQVAHGTAAGPNADPNGVDIPGIPDVQLINQNAASGAAHYEDDVEPGDRYGFVVASGDFNGDTFSDLAVGVPDEDLTYLGVELKDAGAVHVIYGSVSGLHADLSLPDQLLRRAEAPVGGTINSYDRFGDTVESGDFNGDGYADLAIGVPLQEIIPAGAQGQHAGAVDIVYGSPSGLGGGRATQQWTSADTGLPPSEDDRMGRSLGAGDLDGDGRDDLAIGFRREDYSGLVRVVFGSTTGLSTAKPAQTLAQGTGSIGGTASPGDQFGRDLDTGDFDDDGRDDLAIGVPGDEVSGAFGAGTVTVVYGRTNGLLANGTVDTWQQDGLAGDGSETGDNFGYSVAAADANGDSFDDLAVGVPFEDLGGISDGGGAHVIYGSAGGLHETASIANQFWDQASPGVNGGREHGDRLGMTITFDDYNGDSRFDLAIGAPWEDIGSNWDNGSINLLFGANGGITSAGDMQIWQGSGAPGELLGLHGIQQLVGSGIDGQASRDLWNTIRGSSPGPVRNLAADPGDARITLSWDGPIDRGGLPLEYHVSWASAGDSGSLVTTDTSVELTGLHPYDLYDFEVGAAPIFGTVGPIESVEAAPIAMLRSITPIRLLETRTGPNDKTIDGDYEGGGRAAADSVTKVKIVGRGGIDSDTEAYMINLTVVDPDAAGYATVFPCGFDPPLASNLNYEAGDVVPNAALVARGIDGDICIYTLAEADLIVDVSGYVPIAAYPRTINPIRIYESRRGSDEKTYDGKFQGTGRRSAGSVTRIDIGDRLCDGCDFDAVMLNVTAVAPAAGGYLTVYDCSADVPLASHVNYGTGETVPNAVLAAVSGNGQVCIYTIAETDLIVDLSGVVAPGNEPMAMTPTRILETRIGPNEKTYDGKFQGQGPLGAGSTLELLVAGRAGVPDGARSVMMNVTAVGPNGLGYLTVYPCGENPPLASHVNYGPGGIAPNAVLAKIGDGGKVCIFTVAETDLIADVSGFVTG